MSKYFLILTFVFFPLFYGFSQGNYTFTVTSEVKTTPVKNQYRSGTCWSFSTISFVETELLRKGKGEFDLSEMYPVKYTYHHRAIDYIRYHGNLNFSGGAQSWDLINGISKYGIVPEEAYPGLEYGEPIHTHGELDNVLKTFLEGVLQKSNGRLTPSWIKSFDAILEAYLGKVPERFTYKGKEYSPLTFANELDFRPDDYVAITSFTHQPYYRLFVFESPDNWAHHLLYNLPLDDLIKTIIGAIEKGYSVQWSSDISEKGFRSSKGVAIVPLKDFNQKSTQEQENTCVVVEPEMDITPEIRQLGFDNHTTTDDHAMHIVGLAKDQNGKLYFKVKNSHGTSNPYQGYIYVSEAYVRFKTMSIMLHKSALSKDISKKMGVTL